MTLTFLRYKRPASLPFLFFKLGEFISTSVQTDTVGISCLWNTFLQDLDLTTELDHIY